MEGYKGFDKELKYKGVQYEIGEEFAFAIGKDLKDLDLNELNEDALHFCKYPLDVLGYCEPVTSRFVKVEATGDIIEENPDNDPEKETLVFTNKLKVCKEIKLSTIVHAAVEHIKSDVAKYDNSSSKEQKDSNMDAITSSLDDYSLSVNTGHKSIAANTGNCGMSTNTGDRSMATNVGYRSLAENIGMDSIAANTGNYSIAKNAGSVSASVNTGLNSASTNTGFRSVAANTGLSSLSINTGHCGMATNTGDRSNATVKSDYSVAVNTGDESIAYSSGDNSASINTGYKSAAISTSYEGVATNTGDDSIATNTGNKGVSVNTGDWSGSIVTGKNSVAISTGCKGFAKAPLGSWIVLSEWMCGSKVGQKDCVLKEVKAFKVDGKEILPDTFYRLVDGKPVVADDFSEDLDKFIE